MSTKEKLYKATRQVRMFNGELHFHLDVFGDHLAKKYQYKEHSGIDAVWYFLVEKHHWTPATVRALNTDDLRFLLAEEMSGWTLPAEAMQAKDNG